MTTIATDGVTMSADGNSVNENDIIISTDHQKVFRLKDGSLFGAAGAASLAIAARRYFDSAEKKPVWPAEIIPGKAFCALLVRPDGTIYWVGHNGILVSQSGPAAIGSGSTLALGAMYHGASPRQAVMIACAHDPFSGGLVHTVHRSLKEVRDDENQHHPC